MKRERERVVERFLVKTESGEEYTIIQYQKEISVMTHDSGGWEDWIPTTKRLTTSTGIPVNYIDPKTFKVVNTGEIVRKI